MLPRLSFPPGPALPQRACPRPPRAAGEEMGMVRGDTGQEEKEEEEDEEEDTGEEVGTGEDTGEEVGTAGGEPRRGARGKNRRSPCAVCALLICSRSNSGVAVGQRFL